MKIVLLIISHAVVNFNGSLFKLDNELHMVVSYVSPMRCKFGKLVFPRAKSLPEFPLFTICIKSLPKLTSSIIIGGLIK